MRQTENRRLAIFRTIILPSCTGDSVDFEDGGGCVRRGCIDFLWCRSKCLESMVVRSVGFKTVKQVGNVWVSNSVVAFRN